MKRIASWVRECDEPNFERFVAARPGFELLNARRQPLDVKECDGLLLTGGPDIDASFLRQPVGDPAAIEDAEPERDAWEFAAVAAALEKGIPVFAVCKGHQLLNVAFGGTLLLDIPNHRDPECRTGNLQPLRYADRVRPRFDRVNSSHHQAIDQPGDGLNLEAWCATDGVIEQVRLRDYPFALGVQFHPERDWIYAPLFEEFFDAVEQRQR
jgi:putative glutamine amidotransferase